MPRKGARDAERHRGGDIDPDLLPSRVAILAALEDTGVPMPPAELERTMRVPPIAREAFHGRLAAMQRDGQLMLNRKGELCVAANFVIDIP